MGRIRRNDRRIGREGCPDCDGTGWKLVTVGPQNPDAPRGNRDYVTECKCRKEVPQAPPQTRQHGPDKPDLKKRASGERD